MQEIIDIAEIDTEEYKEIENKELEKIESKIKECKNNIAQSIFTIGEELTKAKGILQHGEFIPWLKDNVKISERSARNYMRVYKIFGAEEKRQALANLDGTKLIMLAELSDDERSQFIQMEDIESITTRELQDRIKSKKKSQKKKQAPKQESLQSQSLTMDSSQEDLNKRMKQLQEEMQKIKDLYYEKMVKDGVQLQYEIKDDLWLTIYIEHDGTRENFYQTTALLIENTPFSSAYSNIPNAFQNQLDSVWGSAYEEMLGQKKSTGYWQSQNTRENRTDDEEHDYTYDDNQSPVRPTDASEIPDNFIKKVRRLIVTEYNESKCGKEDALYASLFITYLKEQWQI